jgi:hypothetical protein
MMLSFQIGASLLAMSGAFKCGWTRSLYSSEHAVDRQARARYITRTIDIVVRRGLTCHVIPIID